MFLLCIKNLNSHIFTCQRPGRAGMVLKGVWLQFRNNFFFFFMHHIFHINIQLISAVEFLCIVNLQEADTVFVPTFVWNNRGYRALMVQVNTSEANNRSIMLTKSVENLLDQNSYYLHHKFYNPSNFKMLNSCSIEGR